MEKYLKKRQREIEISNDDEIINDYKKYNFIKRLSDYKKDYEKEIQYYEKFIKLLSNKKINDTVSINELNSVFNIENKYTLKLIEKQKKFYVVKNEIGEIIFCYKKPKILALLFNLNYYKVNICFTSAQIQFIIDSFQNYKISIYSIQNNLLERGNIIGFENLEEDNYLYIINNKIEKLDEKFLEPKNFFIDYKCDEKNEEGLTINKYYFYYFDIDLEFQKGYNFIKTNQRENFEMFIISFFSSPKKFLGICGCKGIGKTSSLLYLSGKNDFNIFYINFRALYKQTEENTITILKVEICKLFSSFYEKDNIHIKNIFELINNFKKNQDLFLFLKTISIEIEQFILDKQIFSDFIIILDQYTNEINFDLYNYIQHIASLKTIKVIVCSTLNNDFIKENLLKTIKDSDCNLIPFHYFSPLIIENDDINTFLFKNQIYEQNVINKFRDFGYIPYFYYFLKSNYNIELVINKIIEDIKNYLGNNYISIIIDLLELINSNYLLSSFILYDLLDKIPLKYITITKKDIFIKQDKNEVEYYINEGKINDEKTEKKKKYEFDKNYVNLLKYYFDAEEIIKTVQINRYLHLNEIEKSLFQKKQKHKKVISKNIIEKFNFPNSQLFSSNKTKKITVYKLNYLFPLMEYIFSKIIYLYIFNNYSNISKLLDLSSLGGLFELMVTYNIMNFKKILNIEIKQFLRVNTIVPSNFSIKFFSYKRRNKNMNYNWNNLNSFKKQNLNISYEVSFIKQEYFNGKYYDIALIIPTNDKDKKEFILIVFQISNMKKKEKIFSKEEHELILRYVKFNLEATFNIKIVKAYFYYI